MLFKDWYFLAENSELQQNKFKQIVVNYFPTAKFYPTQNGDGIWTNIDYMDRIIKLIWEPGLSRILNNSKDVSNVYISVTNKDAIEDAAWNSAKNLRRGSLDIVKKVKSMVKDLTDNGMAIEYIPNDVKKSNFYKSSMRNMGISRIKGSNYWAKTPPQMPENPADDVIEPPSKKW